MPTYSSTLGVVLSMALASVSFASACTTTTLVAPAAMPDAAAPDQDADTDASVDVPDPRLEGRPYSVHAPPSYDGTTALPLLLAFHGYGDGDDGELLESYFKLSPVADAKGFLYVTPNGTKDSTGQQFWNGTDACCDFEDKKPDDVGYVRALVADVAKHYALDPKRVYAVGLSGGAFFVHRLACDAPDVFAAVISVSGAAYEDDTRCQPTEGVSVVELHGDKDNNVLYAGGTIDDFGKSTKYPSAHETVARWAGHEGCTGALVSAGPDLDLDRATAGAETTIEHYEGCTKGAVELWTNKGGVHAPPFGSAFGPSLWTFFAAHPKP